MPAAVAADMSVLGEAHGPLETIPLQLTQHVTIT